MSPKTKKTTGPIPVEAITHDDKRANLPTADAHEFVSDQVEQPIPVRYPRDPTLDPQLVWRGKDELDGEDLVADAPPIYIQEKIDPRVLIENLRQTATNPEDEPELTLFETFDGLDELDLVEFYEHDANWSNRMILGDSLNVMASLAEREALRGKVQMIYIDPPYGIKFNSNWQTSARKRKVEDGNLADATREVEQIKAFRDTWELGIHSYLTYLRDRLVAARDLLTESGSVFVQIGDENVHLVRAMIDEVFGSENFVAQIAVQKSGSTSASLLPSTLDYLLWYAVDIQNVKYRPLLEAFDLGELDTKNYRWVEIADGSTRTLTKTERDNPASIPADERPFRFVTATSQDWSPTRSQPLTVFGETVTPGDDRHWSFDPEIGLERLEAAGRLAVSGSTLSLKRYLDDFPVAIKKNVWLDTGRSGFGDKQVYVVQTNTKIVQRCVLMTTDPGDLVLDPTCGSGTTAVVAEQWGRRWITIDTSRVALALARQRIMANRFPYYLLTDSPEGRAMEAKLSASPLPTAPLAGDIRHGFVNRRVARIQPSTIAANPDIHPGMGREEVDAAIRRHAEFALLYDEPYEDKRKVRVSGPFTVESLSPHRSLGFAGSAVDDSGATNTDDVTDVSRGDVSFEQSILSNLRSAGIQNGRKQERLEFNSVEPFAATYIQAIAEREQVEDGGPKRVGLAIGPQYGTVGPSFVKDAAREAIKDGSIDLLCVLAFAFDPSVLGGGDEYVTSAEGFAEVAAERKLGKVPVLLVRMNAELVMGEELKKTGAGNLFTVFGEPDVIVEEHGDERRVILRGVDVYDPNTGEIRSDDTDQIALWMIDTNYNGESFFVRHCYFTGGQDPYKRLKTALKADIDEDAWEGLHATESRWFTRPETGRIAVKVINDYGDEVLKVFDV